MRPGQQNKRSRGRNNNSGGRRTSNPLSRSYESNGPDVKVRGSAQHVAEKYTTLARDSASSGDRVMAENYLQHAEHYNRIVAAAQAMQQERQQREDRDENQGREGRADDSRRGTPNGSYDRGNGRHGGNGQDHSAAQRGDADEDMAMDGSGPQPFVDDVASARPQAERGEEDGQPRRRRSPRKPRDAEGAEDAEAPKPRRRSARKAGTDDESRAGAQPGDEDASELAATGSDG